MAFSPFSLLLLSVVSLRGARHVLRWPAFPAKSSRIRSPDFSLLHSSSLTLLFFFHLFSHFYFVTWSFSTLDSRVTSTLIRSSSRESHLHRCVLVSQTISLFIAPILGMSIHLLQRSMETLPLMFPRGCADRNRLARHHAYPGEAGQE
jgi:hypothetical protein